MRKTFEVQLDLGAVPIEQVQIPFNSRDELPPTLQALKWIFTNPLLNQEIFTLLEKSIIEPKKATGRMGMDLWQILVLGVVRLTLNINYDRLQHVANYDTLVRQMLGLPVFDSKKEYKLSTLKENIPLLSESLLGKINEILAQHGSTLIKKKNEALKLKADSYVFESNVHFPTDLNLALDCARKCIYLTAKLAKQTNLQGWRKKDNWHSIIKGLARTTAKAARSGGKNKEQRILDSVEAYLSKLYQLEEKVNYNLQQFGNMSLTMEDLLSLETIHKYHELLIKHIFLISDRLLEGKIIPANEKLYSIFEQHTEWVNKGKSRPNVELGHRLLITTDQYGLVHDYKIMSGGNEGAEVIPLVDRLINKIGLENIQSFSVDRGFSTIENRELLELYIPNTVMPKKGKLSQADKERQSQKKWKKLSNEHSAVESDINCLEHHGLDRCPDKGYEAYSRYVGLGILSYNLHKIGNHLQAEQREAEKLKALAA